MTLPIQVRRFLKMCDLREVSYVSAVVTRLGLYFNDFKRIDKLILRLQDRSNCSSL